MKLTKTELKKIIKEALKEELGRKPVRSRKLRESRCPVEEFTVEEYADLIGGNIDDWDLDGKRAVRIYEPEEDLSGQVGVEFEDGTFGYVGANMDGFARSKEHMLRVICDESCKPRKARAVREAAADDYNRISDRIPTFDDIKKNEYTVFFGNHESCDLSYDSDTGFLTQKYYDPDDTFKYKVKTANDFSSALDDMFGDELTGARWLIKE